MSKIETLISSCQLLPGVSAAEVLRISKTGDLVCSAAIAPTIKSNILHKLKTNIPSFDGDWHYKITPRQVNSNVKRHAKIKNVIAVGAGKGGVGKSSIALNLARSLKASGVKVGLLDFDVYGPNIPLMCGDKSPDQSIAQHDLVPKLYSDMPVISLAQVVASADPILWRGPMAGKVAEQLFWSSDWPELDYLVIDLPPGTGDIHIALSQKLPVTASLLVTTPQSIACMDAAKAATMFEKLNVPVLGFVNNMAYYDCQSCGSRQNIFMGSQSQYIAEELGVDCLLELPLDKQLAQANENADELPEHLQQEFANLAMAVALKLNSFKKDRSILMPEVSVVNKEQK